MSKKYSKFITCLFCGLLAFLFAANALTPDKDFSEIENRSLAQRPKLAPHIPAMRDNLARVMGVSPDRVNVKATTEEGLGFTGTGEGIAAHAAALIEEI